MENLQELKAAIEEITEQINNPQRFVVSVQRDSADIQEFRSKMANLADALESRLREIEERSNPSVHIESGDWVNRLENRLSEMENNIIKEVGDLRKEVKEVKDKIDELNAKFTNLLESYPTWRCIRTFSTKPFAAESVSCCVAISLNAQTLATIFYLDQIDDDYGIKLWNLNNGQEICTFKIQLGNLPCCLALSSDGQTLASGYSDGSIKLFNLASKKEICVLEGDSSTLWSVAFSQNGQTLASSYSNGIIKIWNWVSQKEISIINGYSDGIICVIVTISPDGKILAICSRSKHEEIINLWQIEDEEAICTFTMPFWIWELAFSPDVKILASSSEEGINLWNLTSQQQVCTLIEDSKSSSVTFSPDGKTLASGRMDGIIKLWDWISHQEISSLTEHKESINLVAFSPNGKTLISCDSEGTVKVWQQFLKPVFEVLGEKLLEKLGESNRK